EGLLTNPGFLLLLVLFRQCRTNFLATQNTNNEHPIVINTVVNGVATVNAEPVAEPYMVNSGIQTRLICKLFKPGLHTAGVSLGLFQTEGQNTVYINRFKVFVST